MLGKLLGRLAYREWRDSNPSDRTWARNRDERLWRQDWESEQDTHPEALHSWECRICNPPWPFDEEPMFHGE